MLLREQQQFLDFLWKLNLVACIVLYEIAQAVQSTVALVQWTVNFTRACPIRVLSSPQPPFSSSSYSHKYRRIASTQFQSAPRFRATHHSHLMPKDRKIVSNDIFDSVMWWTDNISKKICGCIRRKYPNLLTKNMAQFYSWQKHKTKLLALALFTFKNREISEFTRAPRVHVEMEKQLRFAIRRKHSTTARVKRVSGLRKQPFIDIVCRL